MKNKKGFTLIELLAVIVILGVILVIATTNVLKTIRDSKEKAKFTAAKDIVQIAEAYMYEKDKEGCVSVKTMVDDGYLENDVTNPFTGENISASDDLNGHQVCISKGSTEQKNYSLDMEKKQYEFDGYVYKIGGENNTTTQVNTTTTKNRVNTTTTTTNQTTTQKNTPAVSKKNRKFNGKQIYNGWEKQTEIRNGCSSSNCYISANNSAIIMVAKHKDNYIKGCFKIPFDLSGYTSVSVGINKYNDHSNMVSKYSFAISKNCNIKNYDKEIEHRGEAKKTIKDNINFNINTTGNNNYLVIKADHGEHMEANTTQLTVKDINFK